MCLDLRSSLVMSGEPLARSCCGRIVVEVSVQRSLIVVEVAGVRVLIAVPKNVSEDDTQGKYELTLVAGLLLAHHWLPDIRGNC